MKTKFVYLSILLAFSLSGVNAAVPDCQSVVIGSGVAGMKAAMDLKDGGNKVCLIEKMPFPGGATNLAEFSHARERCSHRCERLKNLVVH